MRGSESKEERAAKKPERTDLDRLLRLVTTTLRRAGKVARAQDTLKVVKRLKQQRAQHEKLAEAALMGNDNNDFDKLIHKSQKKVESLERRLTHIKQFDMDILLKFCMRRLGLRLLGVDVDEAVSSSSRKIKSSAISSKPPCDKNHSESSVSNEVTGNTNGASDNAHSSENTQPDEQLVETLLGHKNLSMAMDKLNRRITEYRKDLLRAAGEEIPGDGRILYRRDRKKAQQQQPIWSKINNAKNLKHEGPGSMFIESLCGEAPSEVTAAQFSHYGPGAEDFSLSTAAEKKNRPGQRARRAKAIVQQAKKEGRNWDSSVNWREPKPKKAKLVEKTEQGEEPGKIIASGLIANKKIKAAELADMGKDWKADGKAHPSWAAKQLAKQTCGIAEFKGKKTTF